MTKKEQREFVNRVIEVGKFKETIGNKVWKNDFYILPSGSLVKIQYHNGKLVDVINFGKC